MCRSMCASLLHACMCTLGVLHKTYFRSTTIGLSGKGFRWVLCHFLPYKTQRITNFISHFAVPGEDTSHAKNYHWKFQGREEGIQKPKAIRGDIDYFWINNHFTSKNTLQVRMTLLKAVHLEQRELAMILIIKVNKWFFVLFLAEFSKRHRKPFLCVSIKWWWKFGRTGKSYGNVCLQLVFSQHFSQTSTCLSITR